MASTTIYNNALLEMARGTLSFPNGAQTDIKVLLVGTGSNYVPSKGHSTLAEIKALGTNPLIEAAGTGYTTNGKAPATITTTINSTTNAIEVAFDDVSWLSSTIASKGAVIYKASTGALVAYIAFDATVTSSNSTFTVDFISPLRLLNGA